MEVPTWVWYLTVGLMAAVLLFDVFIIARRPHVPSTKEVSISLAFYIGAALLFGLGIWYFTHDQAGGKFATEYYAGWLTEYSLSVDNLFIFLLIMARFGVPEKLQQSALLIGIIIAIALRGVFIAAGAAAINRFSWVFYIFGAFLIYTAVKLGKEGETDDEEYEENRFMKWVEQRFPATDRYDGAKLFTHIDGKKLATPMFIVIMALGTTDLLFALDSIPAIYGLTKEPYLVLTANLFALMGLRQLYFLIGGLLKKLVYLSLGLAVLLAFIGVKLVLHALHENELPFINGGENVHSAPDIPISVSLGAIVVILGVTTVASLWKSRKDERERLSAS
ncbi:MULTISPECIES: TerC family protein [unclassified Phycicoccus]|uniref:TerC family protein n=1 Tax=unclassified Phycicoccus TaxID=2637926 RepID=UPI0007032CB1|nr:MULTISPECIES: TerC family protein [unclassified Phycicoccus]KRF26807.1 tellurium resistance protein TerC [Phycicoccus sp. Soil803]KRF30134.1 tellurium resistance protein TerC [Phycicoccus sp. Soil802]